MKTIRDRYQEDPAFHAMVDMMWAHIEAVKFTPTEIREAAMLAQILYEERHLTRPMTFTREQVASGKV